MEILVCKRCALPKSEDLATCQKCGDDVFIPQDQLLKNQSWKEIGWTIGSIVGVLLIFSLYMLYRTKQPAVPTHHSNPPVVAPSPK
jgi:hypothetical protein